MKGRIFTLASTVSLILCLAMLALWAWSHSFPPGSPSSCPRIPLPTPSDAEEWFVLTSGSFEWWEYTPWDGKWYQLALGVPVLLAALVFAALPLWWYRARLQTQRKAGFDAM